MLWKVVAAGRGAHAYTGGKLDDELLGHDGNDTLDGGAGADVLWGDWDPVANGTRQHDKLYGGAGNDWIYSHGKNVIAGGSGNDHIWAYYGHGTIDCGSGRGDIARIRHRATYTTRHCEHVVHF